ncbi:MAG: RAxF-45 family protein [Bacilli bacterium]
MGDRYEMTFLYIHYAIFSDVTRQGGSLSKFKQNHTRFSYVS